MAKKRRVRRYVKSLISPRTWSGYDHLKEDGSSIIDLAKRLVTSRRSKRVETFAEALERLNLKEQDLNQRLAEFRRLTAIFTVITLLIFSYGFYMLSRGHFLGFLLSTTISLIALTQAFRYHFWTFQIHQRRLGCSFRDWWVHGFLGR